ncbi:unnamed protein product [Schistosoma margrebowiei]|uniref:Uncharacterized protein n=1 Tax=Schistosoma margrebowiei TaxID=48269 RepID=A0A183LCB4_9TREM|nr:unnamed protein product [Schistosoma margrebowiei]
MWETGKTSQIAMEMKRYWKSGKPVGPKVGRQRLNTEQMLLYSGHEEGNALHTQGVALILSKVARNALVGWESHGSRIIKASF